MVTATCNAGTEEDDERGGETREEKVAVLFCFVLFCWDGMKDDCCNWIFHQLESRNCPSDSALLPLTPNY